MGKLPKLQLLSSTSLTTYTFSTIVDVRTWFHVDLAYLRLRRSGFCPSTTYLMYGLLDEEIGMLEMRVCEWIAIRYITSFLFLWVIGTWGREGYC